MLILSLRRVILGVSLVALSFPAYAMFCSTDADLAIADGSGSSGAGAATVTTIEVPTTYNGTVTDLDFDLVIDHTWVGDLIVTLESPDGTVVTLIDRPGTPPGTFGCSNNDISVTLDDEAGTTAEGQCSGTLPAVGGTRQPNGSLGDFDGDTYAGTWTLTVTDNAEFDLGTLISASNCINASTTPVTISAFKTRKHRKSLIAKWQTSSEIFNLGFHLWGKVDGQWQQLNKRLIGSRSEDSLVTQKYRQRVNLLKLEADVTEVGLSALSSSGQEDFYGPFAIGEEYGEEAVPRYIDWAEQRRLHDQSMRQAGYVKINQRWFKQTRKRQRRDARQQRRYADTIIEVIHAGVYKITYEELLAQGIDYQGLPVHKLALSSNGDAVPRIVQNSNKRYRRRFGPGSEIVFFANGPGQDVARYVDTARYRLSLDSEKVLRAPDLSEGPEAEFMVLDGVSNSHQTNVQFGDKNIYSFGLVGDGWYDSAIRAFGATASKTVNVNVANDALLESPATLSVSLLGVANFPQIDTDGDGELEPNHHYKIYLNRAENPEPVLEHFVNGREQVDLSIPVSGQLKHGDNQVEVEVIPDNGYNIDVAYFIGGSLSFDRPNLMLSGALNFVAPSSYAPIAVQEQGDSIVAVYSSDADDNFARRPFWRDGDSVIINSPANPSARTAPALTFVTGGGYLQADSIYQAQIIENDELDLSETDYVVIADVYLLGEDLQRFSARHNELGRRTKVVSAQSIYQRYANGAEVPQAIAHYLAEQAKASPYKYVLLVGGHTYNYLGYNSSEEDRPINLIPTFYRGTDGLTQQIPTAVPFVDFDFDGAPDRAIGRWPVRDLAQLRKVVDKTLAWHAQDSHRSQQSALFIADSKEDQNDFTQSSKRLTTALGLNYNPWPSPNTMFLDDVNANDAIAAGDKISSARNQIVDAINQGPALTVFSGHAAPNLWGKHALVNANVADRFQNQTRPSMMIPLACYTTYYETPSAKSLSEILLTDSDAGAVALSGAALLSEASDNEHFGKGLLEKMSVQGLDLGTAVMQLKRENHAFSPRHQTIVYNWVTLGDPTLSFGLPDVTPPPAPNQPKQLPVE